jgi:hypothetical protein
MFLVLADGAHQIVCARCCREILDLLAQADLEAARFLEDWWSTR